MSAYADAMTSLHTTLIDSRNGYEEALKDASEDGMVTLFQEMVALRTAAAVELEPLVRAAGGELKQEGSFMSTVHRAVISFQSILTGLDESILPGLIDGEKRVLASYDDAMKTASGEALSVLQRQRQELLQRIAEMERRRATAA